MKNTEISTEEFDRRPGREIRRVNVDFPVWMLDSLDNEAARLGIPRQAIIKVWIADRLRAETAV